MVLILSMLGCAPGVAEGARALPTFEPASVPAALWPEFGAPLEVLPARAPRGLARRTVYLSAGHYNRGKRGNIGVHGQVEAHVNRDTVLDLAKRLEAMDRFNVVVSRRGEEKPSYRERIAHAKRVGADVFVELHTDARGDLKPWADSPGDGTIYQVEGEAGFAVLFNEGGSLGPERQRLGEHVAESLGAAGFVPYQGTALSGLYDTHEVPGVFIDRRGLMMLRRPEMPSIILETHNAKDYEEALRWREDPTMEAFGAAIGDALTQVLTAD